MGCVASKDAVETNRNSRGGNRSMPVQVQGKSDNGYHMVALTSSTYGILKVDDVSSVSLSNSSHDAFHEKLKQFDFPDEMHAKSWSEVSRSLPKIPPPTRTDSPLQADSLRRMDSPRLQTQGLDSPRQNKGGFRGTDSPRLGGNSRLRSLPSQVTKNNHEVINTWELMDGLDKDGNAPKLKPVERVPASPSVKPFERSVTFSTIHTLSELDSGDPSKAIATAPAVNSSNSVVNGGKENTNPFWAMSRSASSPIVPTWDEKILKLTPSSPSPEARMNASGTNRSPESSHSKSPVVKAVDSPKALKTEAGAGIERAHSEARGVGRRQSFPKQPAGKMSSEPDSGRVQEVANRPPESSHSKSPVVKAVDSPKALKTKSEAGIERAHSEARGVGGRQPQPAAKVPLEPDSGRVQAAVMSLRKEAAVASPPPILRRAEGDETSNRQVPRFASPIHVLSLAASFDLENLKNSRSQAAPGQASRRSLSNHQSMPSPSLRAIPSVGLQSQASAPSHGSSDDLQSVRDSKGEITSFSAATDINRPANLDANKMSGGSEEGVSRDKDGQGISNNGANVHLAAQRDTVPSTKAVAPRQKVEPDPWARFEVKCPPDGDDRVVLYTTSLRGIRKTFEDCNAARFIFESFNVVVDERDVSIHAEFRQELKELAGKPVPVPQAFIQGRYIGGLDVISELHENGILATLVVGLPPQLSRGECDGCGGVRFVPCSDCSGSTKLVNDAKEVVRCLECNENGLMRCPICY